MTRGHGAARRNAMSPHVYLSVRRSDWRLVAAAVLYGASVGLERVARRLVPAAAPPVDDVLPHVEFHADAGALEGALYVDGRFVGVLHGVSRL
jgi:hypothetical protein